MEGQLQRFVEAVVDPKKRGEPDPVPWMQPERNDGDDQEVPGDRVEKEPLDKEGRERGGKMLGRGVDPRVHKQAIVHGVKLPWIPHEGCVSADIDSKEGCCCVNGT